MKILHINGTSEGGTFNLVYDLHKALIKKKNQIKYLFTRKNRYKNSHYPKSFFSIFYSKIVNF